MTSPASRTSLVIALVFVISMTVVWLFHEEDCFRIASSDGRYTAIVTCRHYTDLMGCFPGQAGDKAGFIRIEGADGVKFGRIPIPMVWMAREIEWTSTGAKLKLIGEWNFLTKEYRYWNKAQTQEIVKSRR